MNDVQKEFIRKNLDKLYYHDLSVAFRFPITEEDVQDYTTIIKEPMDLGTLYKNLDEDKYKDEESFLYDLNLIWSNCKQYNKKDHLYYIFADLLEKKSKKYFKEIPKTEKDNERIMLDNKIRKIQKRINNLFSIDLPDSSIFPRTEPSTIIKDLYDENDIEEDQNEDEQSFAI